MADTGLTSEFLHKLNEDKKRYTSKLQHGHPKTFDEYKRIVGYLEGLEAAERILHDTIKLYMELQDAE